MPDRLAVVSRRLGRAVGRVSAPMARRARLVPWGRVAMVFTAFVVLVALVPALRWPVLRITTAAATTVVAPVRPDVDDFGSLDRTTTFVDRQGEVLQRIDGGRRSQPVALADLPPHVPRAVLAAEDRNFFEHPGVDPTALARAAIAQVNGGDQGGSTVTQQLAKINFTGNEPSLLRKAREAMYAAELEREFTKEELLERYLNQVYFGDGAYGISTAAQTFFGVEPAQLTLSQAATLAAKIRAPDTLDPHDNLDAVVERRDKVLDAMAGAGWATPEQARAARAEAPTVKPQERPRPSRAPWFLEYVKDEASRIEALGPDPRTRLHRLTNGGYTIETTLDLASNEVAAGAVRTLLDKPDHPTAAVVSIEPGLGAVRVMVGGVDFGRQQFNAAAQARRQPGSAFKPFVYLAALDKGIDPRSTFQGHSPQQFEHGGEKFEVRNYGERSYGTVDLDEALTKSINTVYMGLGLEVGPEAVVRTARRAGIDQRLHPVPATSLGGTNPGVTPVEMAEAYATLAAEGTHAAPYAIERIRDVDGDVVYERDVDQDETIRREHVLVMNRPLMETVKRGTGRAAALDGREVAGKTGTSSEFRDAWFVGYVPQLATAVWVGHLDNRSMEETVGRVSGGSFPARIFHDTMAPVLQNVEPLPITILEPDALQLEIIKRKAKTPPTSAAPPTSATTAATSTTVPPEPSTTTPPTTAPKRKEEEPTTTAPPTTDTTATTSPPGKDGGNGGGG